MRGGKYLLDEYKELYRQKADSLNIDWKKMSKNELCFQYIAHENTTYADAFLSAIMCRYWSSIQKMHGTCGGLVNEFDVYEWLTDAVLYALKHRKWEDPESPLYGDPNAPDKVINRAFKCSKLTYFQQLNRFNRKLNIGLASIEALQESMNDASMPFYNTENVQFRGKEFVKSKFNSGEYFDAIMVFHILYSDVFEIIEGERKFSLKRLTKAIKSYNSKDVTMMSSLFDLSEEECEFAMSRLSKNSLSKLETLCKNSLDKLSKTKELVGE